MNIALASLLLAHGAGVPFGPLLEEPRLFNTRGELTTITPGVIVDGLQVGTLYAELDFQSDRIDPQTGRYVLGSTQIYWAYEDGAGERVESYSPGGRYGVQIPGEAPVVQSFDSGTGQGRVLLSVPVGTPLFTGSDYPRFLEGSNEIHVALGFDGDMTVDAAGVLQGELATGIVFVDVAYPEVWIEFPSKWVGVDSTIAGVLHAGPGAGVERVFQLGNEYTEQVSWAGELIALSGVLSLPPGVEDSFFEVHTLGLGSFELEVLQEGSLVGHSDWVNVDARAAPQGVDPVLASASAPSAPVGEDELAYDGKLVEIGWYPGYQPPMSGVLDGPEIDGGLGKDCKHPAPVPKPNFYVKCSECSISPQVECPEFLSFATYGYCDSTWSLIANCIKKQTGTQIRVPVYQRTEGPTETELGCPKVIGHMDAQGTITIGPITGGLGGGQSIEVQTYKRCCDYELVQGAGSLLRMNDCL